jgi:sulfoxide reductase heme-binding subunit YedZ
MRRIGPVVWRRVHWLTYPVAVLGAVHFALLTKTWAFEPLAYLAAILALLATRVPVRRLATA